MAFIVLFIKLLPLSLSSGPPGFPGPKGEKGLPGLAGLEGQRVSVITIFCGGLKSLVCFKLNIN